MGTRRGRPVPPPIKAQAEAAAKASRLPGWTSGPADAFRHIAASAEATRRYGGAVAWTLGEANEQDGSRYRGQTDDDLDMDRHNNAIGRRIGATAKTYDEIIERTKAAIDAGVAKGGSGKENTDGKATPIWLSKERWEEGIERDHSNWPPVWKEGRDGRAERILARPVEDWTDDDVRTVQNAHVYWRGEGPARERAFAKVRQWHEARVKQPAGSSGGPVSVRPYVRDDGTQVAGHSRAAPR